MNRSPLHQFNATLGARFVDFGGWEMPVQYQSVIAEHKAVRQTVGFFDVTHLGRFELKGPGAHDALSTLLCNDVNRIEPGRSQYSMMLNSDGGIVDDLIVWWWGEGHYWVLPNAANHERVMAAFANSDGCDVADLQSTTLLMALQGPDAPGVFEDILGRAPKRFRTDTVEWEGGRVSMAGTGYTGERGGEICTDANTSLKLAEALVEAGVTPCGLGARDTLRLEAGLALWGEDIDESTTPLEAGLDFAVSFDHDFVGRASLLEQQRSGLSRRLTGFVLEGRGIPRHGHEVRTSTGASGSVTSGNISPMLETGVGLAYIAPPPPPGESLQVKIRDRWVPGQVAIPPFHKQAG